MNSKYDRYSRQILFSGLGEQGQKNLMDSTVLLCGCGALGTVIADSLTRAGVGKLRIVDRDFVEISNLQRQVLFDERDVESQTPKAIAAANKLTQINSEVTIEPVVADVNYSNIMQLLDGVDLILDGTDNFEIRFLINDVSLEKNIPWIYGGCIGSHGQVMTIFPNESACLRCLIDSVPAPGTTETCDTAGILGPTVNVVASMQVVSALKLLTGNKNLLEPVLTIIDIWDGSYRKMNIADLRERSNCPACIQGERIWLSGERSSQSSVLCGRNAVQVSPQERLEISLEDLAEKLRGVGEVKSNQFLLKLVLADPDYELTVFRDGRAIIKGTDDPGVAKGLYARFIGV